MQETTVLLANDDPCVRRCVRRVLEQIDGVKVCWEASNGLEALVMARLHGPQLVIVDARLPRMDGIEVTLCLRRENPWMRIIVTSAFEHMREEVMNAGADAFVTKDCGRDALCAAVCHVVRGELAEATGV